MAKIDFNNNYRKLWSADSLSGRHLVSMTFCQRPGLDVLSGRHLVSMTFCQRPGLEYIEFNTVKLVQNGVFGGDKYCFGGISGKKFVGFPGFFQMISNE